jgi:aspartyl-tRNA(Asn)/glutamyl-tRNA(Gln) amidotransferase subunit A
MGPLALGTDGAGSVRIPSAFSGIVGLKASFGRVPAWPASPFGSLSHVGPHARTVTDAALLLTVISGPDARDWTSLPFEPRDYRIGLEEGVAGLKIAFSPALGHARVDAEVARSVAQCADLLAAQGASVDAIDPGFEDPLDLICSLWFLGAATLVAGIKPEIHDKLDPFLVWQAKQGERMSAVDTNRIQIRRAELGTRMRLFHQKYDLLLTPGVAVPALPAVETGSIPKNGPADFLGWTPFSYPFNLTQQPALVLPCGLTSDGLPISAQLVGPMHADALVLRAGRALEAALPPWQRPPLIVGG